MEQMSARMDAQMSAMTAAVETLQRSLADQAEENARTPESRCGGRAEHGARRAGGGAGHAGHSRGCLDLRPCLCRLRPRAPWR